MGAVTQELVAQRIPHAGVWSWTKVRVCERLAVGSYEGTGTQTNTLFAQERVKIGCGGTPASCGSFLMEFSVPLWIRSLPVTESLLRSSESTALVSMRWPIRVYSSFAASFACIRRHWHEVKQIKSHDVVEPESKRCREKENHKCTSDSVSSVGSVFLVHRRAIDLY